MYAEYCESLSEGSLVKWLTVLSSIPKNEILIDGEVVVCEAEGMLILLHNEMNCVRCSWQLFAFLAIMKKSRIMCTQRTPGQMCLKIFWTATEKV